MSAPAPLSPFLRPPLATPSLAEAIRASLGKELGNYLTPLVKYCDVQPSDENLETAAFRHGYQLRQAIDALLRYDTHTEKLLDYYRQALAVAQQMATTRLSSLEQVLGPSIPLSTAPSHVEP